MYVLSVPHARPAQIELAHQPRKKMVANETDIGITGKMRQSENAAGSCLYESVLEWGGYKTLEANPSRSIPTANFVSREWWWRAGDGGSGSERETSEINESSVIQNV